MEGWKGLRWIGGVRWKKRDKWRVCVVVVFGW